MSRKLVLLAFLSLFVITALVSQTTSSQSLCNKQCLIPQSGTVYYPSVSVDRTLAETVHNLDTGLSYRTIQAAIDAVETLDGHTILVDAGVYYEHVVVNKTVALIGENSSSTIINGTLDVQANNVEIKRFCIETGQGIWVENVIQCKITETVSRNSGNFGIILLNTSDSQISFNKIYSNYYDGICLDHASNNNTISSNHIRGFGRDGIGIHQSVFNTIQKNIISSETYWTSTGLHIRYASNNTAKTNTIANCTIGIWMEYAHSNTLYHNSFINNTIESSLPASEGNTWDNGCEGNYWSNYTGFDLDHDGIGDSPHVLGVNNTDNHPLMGMFSSYNTSIGEQVNVISNSTIEDFQYFELNSTIKMYVSNMTGNQTFGFCRVCIPHALMNPPRISVVIDNGATTALYPDYNVYDNTTHRWIYFVYEHSTHKIDIIPEFPSSLILPLFMTATLLAVIVYRRKTRD